MHADILMPTVAMTAVIAVVWVMLYVNRIGEMKAKGIDTEDFKGPNNVKDSLENISASDNFKNLFEMPVLFYVLCGFIAVSGLTTPALVCMAWIYVGLRAAHSFIHITYNRVMHRFLIYALSTVLLFVMWGCFALRLMA
jgi:hypothetical protein